MNTRFPALLTKQSLSFIALLLFGTALVHAQIQSQKVFNPTNLNGSNGIIFNALETKTYLGQEVAFVGDVNGDGLDDIALGDYSKTVNDSVYAGITYVIFGTKASLGKNFDLNSLNGTNGFVVSGIREEERVGDCVDGVGDINGDGIDDLLVLSEGTKSMVIYGSRSPFKANMTLQDINGTNGFIVDHVGESSTNEGAGVGDVNGDGVSDFIIGVPHWSGETWVIFGKKSNFPASINATWLDGTKGFRIGKFTASTSSYLVGSAGDVNGDGYKDIIVGGWDKSWTCAQQGNPPNCKEGYFTYVVFGKNTPFKSVISPDSLDGNNGFSISNEEGNFLNFVGTVGDINGDGIDDIYSENKIIFGSKAKFPKVFYKSAINGSNGFKLPAHSLGASPLGDLNNDGNNDFLLSFGDYVVYGKKGAYPDSLLVADLDGSNGFQIKSTNINTSRNTDGNGNFNGDNTPDFIVGDPYNNKAYLFFGIPNLVVTGTEESEMAKPLVHPNPVQDVLHIDHISTFSHITIRDLDGKIVHDLPIGTEAKNTVSLAHLLKGIYMVELSNADTKHVLRLIKQ